MVRGAARRLHLAPAPWAAHRWEDPGVEPLGGGGARARTAGEVGVGDVGVLLGRLLSISYALH